MTIPFEIFDHFSVLAPRYDVVLCDIWGVVHNGVAAYPEACDALMRYRARGGTVVLITNAPRPYGWVRHQLDKLGVPADAYDGIMTSGDLTRGIMAERAGDVFHIGPERDLSIFEGLGRHFATVEDADYAVCTGLFDDTVETPEDYRGLANRMRERGLWMLCANPDLVVDRGGTLIFCAGAIADLYASMGGSVLYAGKPHRPIYEGALAKAAERLGAAALTGRTLAIGDSLRTDMAGAAAMGMDGLFVCGGIHAEELGAGGRPGVEGLAKMFAAAEITPKAVIPRLVW